MSKLHATFELEASDVEAAALSRRAFAQLGWSVVEDSAREMVAREDPARLHCHCSPATVTLAFRRHLDGARVEIETKVPGFGPISSAHAKEQSRVVVRRILALQSGEPVAVSGVLI